MKKWGVVGGAVLALAGLTLFLSDGVRARSGRSARAQTSGATAQPALSPDALDLLLAPIALYPDQLLAQMLLCATTPPKVRELDAWLKKNPSLKGTELQEAAQVQGFEPSFVALALFPQVVDLMAGDLNWTARLGQAFTADRSGVFASIQRLRAQSRDIGNLKSTPQQEVETRTTDSGQQVIVIEPANPQVVYVPQYNPQVVYTQPPTTTTVVVQEESNTGAAVAAGVVGFAAGVAIGAAIDNDHYYGPYGWHGGAYMYNDAWDDWYDDREDAREDWYENREDAREDYQDRREDVANERTERAGTAQEQRTERTKARQENRPESQAQMEQRRTDAQAKAQQARSTGSSTQARSTSASSYESRGYSRGQTSTATAQRSGTRSDAFSGYSSGTAERSASSRGQRSRSSSGGGRSRRR